MVRVYLDEEKIEIFPVSKELHAILILIAGNQFWISFLI